MRAAGRLIKHLSGLVRCLGLAGNLGYDRTFQHVREHEPRMVMGASVSPRRHVYNADVHLPTVHRDVRKIVHEHSGRHRRVLVLSLRCRSGKHRQGAGKNIATIVHGLILYPAPRRQDARTVFDAGGRFALAKNVLSCAGVSFQSWMPVTPQVETTRTDHGSPNAGVLRSVGLGLITGASDDHPSAIGTYASVGANLCRRTNTNTSA